MYITNWSTVLQRYTAKLLTMGRILKKIYGFEDSLVAINSLVLCFEMYPTSPPALETVALRMLPSFVDSLSSLSYLKHSGSSTILNGIMLHGFCK